MNPINIQLDVRRALPPIQSDLGYEINGKVHTLQVSHSPNLGLYSLSGKMTYHQFSWSLKATSLGAIMQCTRKTFKIHQTFVQWALYNLFKFVKSFIKCLVETHILRLWEFTRSCGKSSYCLANRGLVFPFSNIHTICMVIWYCIWNE